MNLRFKTPYVNKQDVRILNLDGNLSYLSTTFRVLVEDKSFLNLT